MRARNRRAARELRASECAVVNGHAACPHAGKSRGLIPVTVSTGLLLCVCVCVDSRLQNNAHKDRRIHCTAGLFSLASPPPLSWFAPLVLKV